jgi:hypothetical protein
MPDLLIILAVVVAVITVAVVVLRRRSGRGPVGSAFQGVASRHGWGRVSATDAGEVLSAFPGYLDDEGGVDLAVGGDDGDARILVAAVGIRDTIARGRPWYVATASRPDLVVPEISFVPRSVRTVRLVSGGDEVVVDDPRIARGWRVSSSDPDAANALEQHRDRLPDVLHRPMPFIVGLHMRPGAVAVHLAGPEAEPTDADDLDRLAQLAREVADAMAARDRPPAT